LAGAEAAKAVVKAEAEEAVAQAMAAAQAAEAKATKAASSTRPSDGAHDGADGDEAVSATAAVEVAVAAERERASTAVKELMSEVFFAVQERAEALVEGEDEETPKVPLPELLQAVKQVIKEATKRFLVASAAPPSP
jgi:hypothetical protein